jgi:ribosomal protein S18 acetylase RimI-like enzyme
VDCNQHGAIQNIGIVPGHRGLGLGTALLLQSLHGFRASGAMQVYLEVTADNSRAVRLYQRLGFRKMKTLYKAVDE